MNATRLLPCCLGLILAAAWLQPAAAFDTTHTISAGFQFSDFTWQEKGPDGQKLLEESGPLTGVGVELAGRSGRFEPDFKFLLFGGTLDYDGQTMDGTPARTDTDYLGIEAIGDLGYAVVTGAVTDVRLFAGLGYRLWERSLASTDDALGYDESWSSVYARLGAGTESRLGPVTLFANAGVKWPFFTAMSADLPGIDDPLELEPDGQLSFFADAGVQWWHIVVSVFYDSFAFDASDPEPVLIQDGRTTELAEFYQPESESSNWGLNVGWLGKF
jgi:hypothetical protein